MKAPRPAEDVRASRPYLLSSSPIKTLLRRLGSIAALVAIDICGLLIGLYVALALRALVVDPKPILWGLLWDQETTWLAFLILLLVLVFWRAGLYAPRELREGAGRVVPSVFLVAALALAFAIGTGQHFTTFGLYVVGAILVAVLIGLFRASYELVTGSVMAAVGVRRKAVLVGEEAARTHLRETLGARRGGIDYEFVGRDRSRPGGRGDARRTAHRRADRRRLRSRRGPAARDRRRGTPPRREGARRAADDGAARRARRVRARAGRAALRVAAADLRRHRLGDQARVRPRRRRR